MILREIKNIFIKNRLTEGVDFKRYEWLKGDGSAKISIIFNGYRETLNYTILPIESKSNDLIYRTFIKISDTDVAEYAYFIGGGLELTLRHGIRRNNYSSIIDTKSKGTYEDNVYNISLKKGNVDNTVIFTIGGSSFNINSSLDSTLDFDASMSIFAKAAKISAFNTDRYNLVPCQLLRSIPATLDANNIARAAGECGMYDSISGKFYGNVANSGTFTVDGDVEPENNSRLQQIYQNKLIEGEDYQTYDWLKGSVPIGTLMMSLPINSSNCNFTYILGSNLGNMNVFTTNGYHYYNGNNSTDDTLSVYDRVKGHDIFTKNNITQPTTVNASDDVLMINNFIFPKYGFPITFINFQNASDGTSMGVKILSSIKVDGVTRYVPCTLLRSIPRNLDAQCKERVAGECGMVDLISGKFYGNVASSGTFTVENDTENNE